ncbi:MAG TPA: 23S rRNA (adenine(2030)-N(6))-methyltransferase RlmJ [Xanthobacteraceae bacterium]|nr:23S rRNA (adenine(2030)-N(6))-methyltransferase RlmJ [Xanthobacteraceae bacterium]
MNYRHGYHAGNFADVFKHAVLARILVQLNAKDAAYRVIDTHAGAGSYDLGGKRASATAEYLGGIKRLQENLPDGEALALLRPYLDAVAKHAPAYPGSPLIAQELTRAQDALVFCELHPEEHTALVKSVGRDRRAKTLALDGWTALKSLLPPKERRGLVLIDPPFEDPGEFRQIADGIEEAMRRFATGIYLVWYPLKNRHDTDAAIRRIIRAAGKPALRLELEVGAPQSEGGLQANGLLVINPPWKLQEECDLLLPALHQALAGKTRGGTRVEALA